MSQKLSKSEKWKWNTLYAIKFFWHQVQAWFDFNNLGSENCLTYAILQFLLAFFFHFRHPVVWLSANFLSNFPGKCDSYSSILKQKLHYVKKVVVFFSVEYMKATIQKWSSNPKIENFSLNLSIIKKQENISLEAYRPILRQNIGFWRPVKVNLHYGPHQKMVR